jgi:hypothetical protein
MVASPCVGGEVSPIQARWPKGPDSRLTPGVSELSGFAPQYPDMSVRTRHRRSFLLGAGFLLLAGVSALADDTDHDLARRLLEEGRIRPLAEVVAAVEAKVPGKMLEVEFELEDGVYIYEIKMLREDGRVQEVEVDAASGTILKVEDDD